MLNVTPGRGLNRPSVQALSLGIVCQANGKGCCDVANDVWFRHTWHKGVISDPHMCPLGNFGGRRPLLVHAL